MKLSEEEIREPVEEPSKIGNALQARLDRIKREFYDTKKNTSLMVRQYQSKNQ